MSKDSDVVYADDANRSPHYLHLSAQDGAHSVLKSIPTFVETSDNIAIVLKIDY